MTRNTKTAAILVFALVVLVVSPWIFFWALNWAFGTAFTVTVKSWTGAIALLAMFGKTTASK